MTDCERISERMPEVAHGGAPWSVDQERHIAGCEACRFEWMLVRRTVRLGAESMPLINETRIAEAVLRKLHTTSPAESISRRRTWLIVGVTAAAAVVFLLLGRAAPSLRPRAAAVRESVVATAPQETARLTLPLPELEDLDTAQLDTVMELLDQPLQANELLESPSASDSDAGAFGREFITSEG